MLNIIKKVYKKKITIKLNYNIKIDRSLNSKALKKITGFKPGDWHKNVQEMLEFSNKKQL